MAKTPERIVSLDGRQLAEGEARQLDLAGDATATIRRTQRILPADYGEPDSDAWPIAFCGEGDRPYEERDYLLWLLGSRVVLETFNGIQGVDGQGWFRSLTDYDVETGEFVLFRSTEKGELMKQGDVWKELDNAVYIQQLAKNLATVSLAYGEFPGKPADWPVQIHFGERLF
jgi:hypothetical protein